MEVRLFNDVLHEIRELLDIVANFNNGTVGDVLAGTLYVVSHCFTPLNLLVHVPPFLEFQSIAQNVTAFFASL
jgi:hypothetical protein